jgi:putative ABC transport system ATP-binding protein
MTSQRAFSSVGARTGATHGATCGAPLLEVADLQCRRGRGPDAYRVSLPRLRLGAGDVLAVTGASGSGKSTLLEVLGLVAAPLPGARFTWLGAGPPIDLSALWRRDAERGLANLRASGIGFVMQTGGLLPFLSVRENLGINRRLLGLPETDDGLERLVEHLELGPLLGALPARLSVGQQQRASIGRALAHRPALLLADEPTSALDPRLAERVLALLLESAAEAGTAVVLATHEQSRVRALGLRELKAETVELNADGTAGAVFSEAAA